MIEITRAENVNRTNVYAHLLDVVGGLTEGQVRSMAGTFTIDTIMRIKEPLSVTCQRSRILTPEQLRSTQTDDVLTHMGVYYDPQEVDSASFAGLAIPIAAWEQESPQFKMVLRDFALGLEWRHMRLDNSQPPKFLPTEWGTSAFWDAAPYMKVFALTPNIKPLVMVGATGPEIHVSKRT